MRRTIDSADTMRAVQAGLRLIATLLLGMLALAPSAVAQSDPSAAAWQHLSAGATTTDAAAQPAVQPDRFEALSLDRSALEDVLAAAPEPQASAAAAPLTISLPTPEGDFQRFAIQRSVGDGAGAGGPASGDLDLQRHRDRRARLDRPPRSRHPRPACLGDRARRVVVHRSLLPRQAERLRQLLRPRPDQEPARDASSSGMRAARTRSESSTSCPPPSRRPCSGAPTGWPSSAIPPTPSTSAPRT